MPLGGVAADELIERGDDGRLVDVVAIQDVQSRTHGIGAETQRVTAGSAADERDLGQIRTRAAIGAAGDAHGERNVLQSVLGEQLIDAIDEAGR